MDFVWKKEWTKDVKKRKESVLVEIKRKGVLNEVNKGKKVYWMKWIKERRCIEWSE